MPGENSPGLCFFGLGLIGPLVTSGDRPAAKTSSADASVVITPLTLPRHALRKHRRGARILAEPVVSLGVNEDRQPQIVVGERVTEHPDCRVTLTKKIERRRDGPERRQAPTRGSAQGGEGVAGLLGATCSSIRVCQHGVCFRGT